MNRAANIAFLFLAISLSALAQEPGSTPQAPAPSNPAAHKQQNAASATQDNSGTSGDQITKPAGAKGATLIGCLAGPDKDGKYSIRNMTYRAGVRVLGSDELKNDSGSKVKLTGQWQPVAQPAGSSPSAAGERRFQVTKVEVVTQTCRVPSETTPVSKTKRQKPTTYNAPNRDSSNQ